MELRNKISANLKNYSFCIMTGRENNKIAACVCAAVALLVAVVVALLFVYRPWIGFAGEPDLQQRDAPVVHVNMTTIPERFASDWFADNMRRLLTTMRGNFVWWCNVPPTLGSTGEPYVVTRGVRKLLKDFPNFRLFHVSKDYGPVTKVLGPVYNPEIPLTAPLLICDDDIQYHPEFVRTAAAHFARDPTRVYSFCGPELMGFRGYVVEKRLCLDIPANMPASCRRIDDDLMNLHLASITTPITYLGDKTMMCTLDASDMGEAHTGNKTALRHDIRFPMAAACRRDFHKAVRR